MKGNVAARRIIGTVSAFLGSVEDIKLQQKEVTPTKDTQQVSADGDYNALSMVTVKPIPDEYIVPSGNQNITENGSYDIADKASVTVRVSSGEYTPVLQDKSATPTKSQQTFNADEGFDGIGTFTVEPIPDEYIIPNGTKEITTNGTHDVTDKASVNVNVPIPDGYIKPSGSLEITENGTYDVTDKASAVVNVSGGGDLVDYTGSVVSSGGTSQVISVGATISETFYFYAASGSVIFKHAFDGTNYVTYSSMGNPPAQVEKPDAIIVSSDRKSITLTSPVTMSAGTMYWVLITEG